MLLRGVLALVAALFVAIVGCLRKRSANALQATGSASPRHDKALGSMGATPVCRLVWEYRRAYATAGKSQPAPRIHLLAHLIWHGRHAGIV